MGFPWSPYCACFLSTSNQLSTELSVTLQFLLATTKESQRDSALKKRQDDETANFSTRLSEPVSVKRFFLVGCVKNFRTLGC